MENQARRCASCSTYGVFPGNVSGVCASCERDIGPGIGDTTPAINPILTAAIVRVTGVTEAEVHDYLSLDGTEGITLVELIDILNWPECINAGCTRPKSNAADECFECRFEPYGSAWQEEQWGRF